MNEETREQYLRRSRQAAADFYEQSQGGPHTPTKEEALAYAAEYQLEEAAFLQTFNLCVQTGRVIPVRAGHQFFPAYPGSEQVVKDYGGIEGYTECLCPGCGDNYNNCGCHGNLCAECGRCIVHCDGAQFKCAACHALFLPDGPVKRISGQPVCDTCYEEFLR